MMQDGERGQGRGQQVVGQRRRAVRDRRRGRGRRRGRPSGACRRRRRCRPRRPCRTAPVGSAWSGQSRVGRRTPAAPAEPRRRPAAGRPPRRLSPRRSRLADRAAGRAGTIRPFADGSSRAGNRSEACNDMVSALRNPGVEEACPPNPSIRSTADGRFANPPDWRRRSHRGVKVHPTAETGAEPRWPLSARRAVNASEGFPIRAANGTHWRGDLRPACPSLGSRVRCAQPARRRSATTIRRADACRHVQPPRIAHATGTAVGSGPWPRGAC